LSSITSSSSFSMKNSLNLDSSCGGARSQLGPTEERRERGARAGAQARVAGPLRAMAAGGAAACRRLPT